MSRRVPARAPTFCPLDHRVPRCPDAMYPRHRERRIPAIVSIWSGRATTIRRRNRYRQSAAPCGSSRRRRSPDGRTGQGFGVVGIHRRLQHQDFSTRVADDPLHKRPADPCAGATLPAHTHSTKCPFAAVFPDALDPKPAMPTSSPSASAPNTAGRRLARQDRRKPAVRFTTSSAWLALKASGAPYSASRRGVRNASASTAQ